MHCCACYSKQISSSVCMPGKGALPQGTLQLWSVLYREHDSAMHGAYPALHGAKMPTAAATSWLEASSLRVSTACGDHCLQERVPQGRCCCVCMDDIDGMAGSKLIEGYQQMPAGRCLVQHETHQSRCPCSAAALGCCRCCNVVLRRN